MKTKEEIINAINAYSDARLTNNEILLKLSIEYLEKIIDSLLKSTETATLTSDEI